LAQKFKSIFSGGTFQVSSFGQYFFGKQVFKFLAFSLAAVSSLAKVQVGFVESLKSASRFLVCVLVCSGFDWLCFVASVLFVVGFARFSKSACLFLAKVLVKVKFVFFQQVTWRK